MYFCRSFLLAALPFLTVAIPLAQPPASRGISIPIAKRNNTFSVEPLKYAQIQRANTIAKINRGIDAYEKNTGSDFPFPSAIETFRKRGETGIAPLTDASNQNMLWYGTIEVGTPPVAFKVVFDTGSSDLFLPASDCTSSCAGHKEYHPSASSSSHDLGKKFKLFFGGSDSASVVSGNQYTDDVKIGEQTACSQTLGVATHYSSLLSSKGLFPDGLMGMAFQSISRYNASPTFQTLVAQGKEENPVFSFKLAPNGSELFLGGANSGLYQGNFTWVKLTTQSYWQAPFDSISVHGIIDIPVVGKKEAIYDTGTSLILGDLSDIKTLYASVPGSSPISSDYEEGFYTIPCDFNTPIVITVGGKPVEISPDSFNLGSVPKAGSNRCLAGAAGTTKLPHNFWVLGDVFLRNVYTSWDVGQARIGFADHR